MTSRKRADIQPSENSKKKFPLRDDDICAGPVSRRSALSVLGIGASAGALGLLLGGCATMVDADSTDGASDWDSTDSMGSGRGGYGGGGGGYERHHDIKYGDGSDYPVYADGSDLDSDSRDLSDYGRERSADRSSSNDYD